MWLMREAGNAQTYGLMNSSICWCNLTKQNDDSQRRIYHAIMIHVFFFSAVFLFLVHPKSAVITS